MITDRDFSILQALALHFTLTIRQIQRLCFPNDGDGRIARRRVGLLLQAKLINKTRCEVVNPLQGMTAAVYFPSRAGMELLAVHTGDDRFLLTPTETPAWQNLAHWVALSDLRMVVSAAVTAQQYVTMPTWFNEFDVVNKETSAPAERYRLYTLIQTEPKRLVAVPDAAFELQVGAYRKGYYVELERGTNAVNKAAAEKSPGYAALDVYKLHRRHFPAAIDRFSVLMFAPDPRWRDALRRAFRGKAGAHLWNFAAWTDLKPETFLHSPIFYPCEGEPQPLVRRAGS